MVFVSTTEGNQTMTEMDYDVLVAGAGPVGLTLAVELRLAGARVLVVERRTEPDTAGKAGAINTAPAEAFARRGLLVRQQAGFEFPGTDPTITFRQTEGSVEGAEELGQNWQHTPTGVYVYGPVP